jgi:hypothetical protein
VLAVDALRGVEQAGVGAGAALGRDVATEAIALGLFLITGRTPSSSPAT